MYMRLMIISLSLILSNPVQSNPLNPNILHRVKRFVSDPTNISILKRGVAYLGSYAIFFKGLHTFNNPNGTNQPNNNLNKNLTKKTHYQSPYRYYNQ